MSEMTGTRKSGWRQDPDGVRANILDVATGVFAENGFSGARIEEIVRRTETSKRMIYYYFGDKEGLYQRVLEAVYARLRKAEEALDLSALAPREALARIAEFTFDFHRKHPDYIRLITIENIHDARNLRNSKTIPNLNSTIIERLERICARGIADGAFRQDVDPVEVHWLISAQCVFNVSNRATFSHLYGEDLFSNDGQLRLKKQLVAAVLGAVIPQERNGQARHG